VRGPAYLIAEVCLRLLPVTARGRRVFDEALADWRSEAAGARSMQRPLVAARALWSIARCVAMVSFREIRTREGMAPLFRITAWSVVVAAVFGWKQTVDLAAGGLAIGPGVALLGSVAWIVSFLPLVAFISGAVGRRLTTPAVRLGPAVAIGLVMFLAMGWLVPAAFQAWREMVFALNSGTGPLPPGWSERSLSELVPMLFSWQSARAAEALNGRLFWMTAVPVLLAIGITVRSMPGRLRLVGTVIPILLFCLPALPQFSRSSILLLMWMALFGAVLVTYVLARSSASVKAAS
jgi:hypothetical protein